MELLNKINSYHCIKGHYINIKINDDLLRSVPLMIACPTCKGHSILKVLEDEHTVPDYEWFESNDKDVIKESIRAVYGDMYTEEQYDSMNTNIMFRKIIKNVPN